MAQAGRSMAGRLLYLLVAGAVLANAGCLAVALSAASGAATAGYLYYKGSLYHNFTAGLSDTLAAVHTGLTELQMPILSEEPGTQGAFVLSRTADGTNVRIHLDTIPSRIQAEGVVTRVSVRVGTFGDEAVSSRILDQVARHLVTPPLAGPPVASPSGPPPAAPPQPVLGPIQPTSATRPVETAPPPLATPEPVRSR
jgi:hypothetical protein